MKTAILEPMTVTGTMPPSPRAAAGVRPWPLSPLAPAVVVVVGLLVALGIGLVGLDALARASEDHAQERAELLAGTLAARLGQLPIEKRLEAIQLASRRAGGEYFLVNQRADVVQKVTLGTPEQPALAQILARKRGEITTRLGHARFAVRPVGVAPATELIVVFVRAPQSPEGAPALLTALMALTTLLVGVAAAVAYAVSRDATRDVDFVERRVRAMVETRVEPTGEPVPARAMDEVAVLTNAFNQLVGRFAVAEKAYRQDLARARAADRDRAAFLAAVSHELRSPLNAILGFADILLTEVDGPLDAESREEVEHIKGSGAHLADLINDILEFSALESGQLKLTRSEVDVGAIVHEVAREQAVVLATRPISLDLEVEGPVVVWADARRVRQIVQNLVGNAIKFTQRGGVVVRAWQEHATVCVSVKDTGPGIGQKEQHLIFEEYKQTPEEKTKKRGSGLGLAIARRLVLLHGGTISLDSVVGKGSTFTVRLPRRHHEATP